MIRNGEAATLAATAIVSIAIGFGAATLLPTDPGSSQPLIDANAWTKTAPAPLSIQPASVAAPSCSDWAISDVAMEEVLDEMIRRGWRPPTQGEAIASLEDARTIGLTAVDPGAPMPYRGTWNASGSTTAVEVTAETPASDPATAEPPLENETPPPPA